MFTQEELKNILVLIERASLTGKEALSVAVLQQKIAKMLEAPSETTGTDPKVGEVSKENTTSTNENPTPEKV